MVAAQFGCEEAVMELLRQGANPDTCANGVSYPSIVTLHYITFIACVACDNYQVSLLCFCHTKDWNNFSAFRIIKEIFIGQIFGGKMDNQ